MSEQNIPHIELVPKVNCPKKKQAYLETAFKILQAVFGEDEIDDQFLVTSSRGIVKVSFPLAVSLERAKPTLDEMADEIDVSFTDTSTVITIKHD